APLDNAFFNLLDGDRRLIDAQHTCSFAWSGTNSPGKFREIVGGMQLPYCVLPAAPIDEIVPVGNHVVDRATGVAEGHAAIHAARTLVAQFRLGEILIDLEPVVDSLGNRATERQLAAMLHEAGCLTHAAPAAPPELAALEPARKPVAWDSLPALA